jgi:uncharacterized protein YegP (UPF0339 family)
MYGIGYTHANASFVNGSGWGMYVASDGDARIFLSGENGNIYANGYLYTSDRKLKKNISTIKSPLEKVSQLRGVDFN